MGCLNFCENLHNRYTIFVHSMEVQTFTTDRGPPTLAMSIPGRGTSLNMFKRPDKMPPGGCGPKCVLPGKTGGGGLGTQHINVCFKINMMCRDHMCICLYNFIHLQYVLYIYVYIFIRGSYVYADMICESTYRDIYILHMYIQDNQSPFNLTAHIDFSTYRTPGSPFDICIPGSSWSWKFRHQSQKLSILPNSREKELMNGYFHSRTLFFCVRTLPSGFESFFYVFLRFWNAILPLQNVQSVPNGKNHSGVLFSTPIPTIDLFLVWS